MATKKVVVSGGEYGRKPMALDANTGQVLWEAPYIIDDGSVIVATPAGNVFIADEENRCVLVTKDGVNLRQGGFGYDPLFTEAIKAAILVMYPDATFGVDTVPLGRLPYFNIGIGDRREITSDSYSCICEYLGDGEFFARFNNCSFGTDAAGVDCPDPANWQKPFGVIFDYDFESGGYSNLRLVGTDMTVQTAINGNTYGFSYFAYTAGYVYCIGNPGGSAPKLMQISRTNGDFTVKLFSPEGSNPCGLGNLFAEYSYCYRCTGDGHTWSVVNDLVNGGSAFLHYKNLDALYTRDAPIAGAGYLFDDRADFDTSASLISLWSFNLDNTVLPQLLIDNNGNVTPNDFFQSPYAVGQNGTTINMSFGIYNGNDLKMVFINADLTAETTEWIDSHVYQMVHTVTPSYGETDYNRMYQCTVTDDYIYGMSNAGWHRITRSTNTIENLYVVGDDDEDWGEHVVLYDWPTFEIPCTVVSPLSNDVADVMLYDELTGQYLRTTSVDGSADIECFTNSHKFAVCKSPDEEMNYKISAHLVPVASA